MKKIIWICLTCIFIAPLLVGAQSGNERRLVGQVVEVTDEGEKGVPKVTVSIPGFDWDITDDRGFFKLTLPPDKELVTVELENVPLKMLSPYDGLVTLPPKLPFQILVCGEENRRLREKADKLAVQIKRLEKEKKLSRRQMEGMHQILLDTILHFENQLDAIGESLQQSKEANKALSEEISARDARIRELESSVDALVRELTAALEEKFLRQKQLYDQVSAELLSYTDRLKDLRDRATPNQLPLFFQSKQASEELNRTIGRYNDAHAAILDHHKGHVLAVHQSWENAAAAAQLESVYRFLLADVHKQWVLAIDARVFMEIRKFEAQQTGRPRAERNAEQASAELVPNLNAAIRELETKINDALNALTNNI
jgi:hypothetical protein